MEDLAEYFVSGTDRYYRKQRSIAFMLLGVAVLVITFVKLFIGTGVLALWIASLGAISFMISLLLFFAVVKYYWVMRPIYKRAALNTYQKVLLQIAGNDSARPQHQEVDI